MRASTASENSPFGLAALKIRDLYDIYLEPYKSDQLTIQTGNIVPQK
jgi:hypothetical protein